MTNDFHIGVNLGYCEHCNAPMMFNIKDGNEVEVPYTHMITPREPCNLVDRIELLEYKIRII